jgi:two-component sensor histidine kinase
MLRSYFAGEADPAPRDEFRFIRPDGKTVWLLTHRAVLNTGGERRIIGVTQDITARKENEMQIALLLREVTHRAKNQYAVVAAVVRETAKKAAPHNLVAEIEARLQGLARSQDLLVRGRGEGATLEDVVRAQLDALALGERCAIAGPPLAVTAVAVQYLGMAVYELATNSVKYGALSAPTGTATIAWSLSHQGDEPEFRFEWREISGPALGPVTEKGFGRTVLEQLAPAALHGQATLRFDPAGVIWILTVLDPFTQAVAPTDAHEAQAPQRHARRA